MGLWMIPDEHGTQQQLIGQYAAGKPSPQKEVAEGMVIVCLDCEGLVNPLDQHVFRADFGDIPEGTVGIYCQGCGYIPREWTETILKCEYLKRNGLKERRSYD